MSNTTPEGPENEGEAALTQDDGARAARGGGFVSDEESPLTLCVDTATDVRSVAVSRGTRVVSLVREAAAQGKTSALLEEIDEALRAAGVALNEIELYAVACGPGSFTGLRTGLATIKAFASIHARPVAAVPTLHAVALSAGASERTLALIPAGRGEVFAQTLSVEDGGRVIELDAASHVIPSLLLRRAAEESARLKLAGSGSRANAETIRATAAGAGIHLIDEEVFGVAPNDEGSDRNSHNVATAEGVSKDGGSADAVTLQRESGGERVWTLACAVEDYGAEIARLGLVSYREGRTVGAHELAASYVRPSDAELNERWRR